MPLSLILYSLFVRGYYATIWVASFFNPKAKQWIDGRKDTWKKLSKLKTTSNERVWFHCSSLGEFEQARPLIEAIKTSNPSAFIAVSFFSPSGYEIRKNVPLADVVFYLPVDTKSNAKRLVDTIQPTKVFWIKYDFWYFMLAALSEKNISNYLVCSIFRNDQVFFKSYGNFFSKQLTFFKTIFVQDESSQQLLKSIHITSTVAGDTRFDRVFAIAQQAKPIESIEQFKEAKQLLIVGSSWDIDIDYLHKSIPDSFFADYKLVVVPHDVTEKTIAHVEQTFRNRTVRLSAFSTEKTATDILIIDQTGLLASIYRYGSFAYIGGGFGKSVHNVLEAAVYGLPILFGPAHKKSKEAMDLIEMKGAITVHTKNELQKAIEYLSNPTNNSSYSKVAKRYVMNNIGATAKIMIAAD